MAAKRITKSATDWARLAERVPEGQKVQFGAFKTRSDNYLRRVLANPEVAPKLDFAAYKANINLPGLVDSFQKQYESLTIPYPKENLTPQITEQEKQAVQTIQQFIADSNKRISEYQAAISKWDKILPFEEMTMEDYQAAFPDDALDPLRRPTFWPHFPEEQIGYKPPQIGAGASQ